MQLYNIKKYRTSAFHPSANGKAERWIKTLKQQLSMLVDSTQRNWDKYLPFIAQAYRNQPSGVHGFSPYEVMFGAKMKTPLTLSQGSPPWAGEVHTKVAEVRERLAAIHELVRRRQEAAATKMKQYYDTTALLTPFKAGDKVFLYHPKRKKGISPKLASPWEGPYTITTIINDCNARVRSDTYPHKVYIVHMDRLAAYPSSKEESMAAWLSYV